MTKVLSIEEMITSLGNPTEALNKEQNSRALEVIGGEAGADEAPAAMDEYTETTLTEPPSDDGETATTDTPEPDNDTTELTIPDGATNNGGSQGDSVEPVEGDGEPDESEALLEEGKADDTDDPHLINNRNILLSTKLLSLNASVKDSIRIISNGPSFPKKPVIVMRLEELSDSINKTNEIVNKVEDFNKILLQYAIAVHTFKEIINNMNILEEPNGN